MAMMKADLLQDVMPSTGNKSTIVSRPTTAKTTGSAASTQAKRTYAADAGDLSQLDALDAQLNSTETAKKPVTTSAGTGGKTYDQSMMTVTPPSSTSNRVTTSAGTGGKTYDQSMVAVTPPTTPTPTAATPSTTSSPSGGTGSSGSSGTQSGRVAITKPTLIAGQPNVEPLPTIEQAVPADGTNEGSFQHAVTGSGDALYGQHSHDEYQNEIPSLQKEIEQILQAEYDKYGVFTQQQIEYATQQAVNNLQRQLEDAAPTYNAERAKLAANQLNARDNLALQNTTKGVNGGIAQKQYSDQEAAYDSQMLNINLQQIQLATDIGRQITDLEAQGDFESAKALLEVGIAKLKELQDAKQNYQNLRIQQAQIVDNYDMESEKTNYARALQRLQMGAFSAADAAAIGVDPSFAQEYANYINDLNRINAESARLQVEQQITALDKARTALAYGSGTGASRSSGTNASNATQETPEQEAPVSGTSLPRSYSAEPVDGIENGADAQLLRYGLEVGGVKLFRITNQNGGRKPAGILSSNGSSYVIDGKVSDIPFGTMIALDGDGDGVPSRYYYDDTTTGYNRGVAVPRGWVAESLFLAEHPNFPYNDFSEGQNNILHTQDRVSEPDPTYLTQEEGLAYLTEHGAGPSQIADWLARIRQYNSSIPDSAYDLSTSGIY